MQRPRRTSELYEEPANKRQSRQSQRVAPSPATAQKYITRQSRNIARPSSLERGTSGSSAFLNVPTTSTKNRFITPQKTPSDAVSKRVLFTTNERSANALHNDAKWVQEKSHIIIEYLKTVVGPNSNLTTAASSSLKAIVTSDSLNRSNFLKQMSIKQFVAILNYFLNFVWGNRFMVGMNHVDDVINILQKLQYPHQVNKSWLKAPNTKQSFGHVIVLLDYLMDFVPTETDLHFLKVLAENQTPDVESRALIFQHSMEGFMLWDKQLDDKFSVLQQKTCDAIILERCGVASSAALDKEIKELRRTAEELEKQRTHIPKKDEKNLYQLEEEAKHYQLQLEKLHESNKIEKKYVEQLALKTQALVKKRSSMEDLISQLQTTIRDQDCSIDQRDKLIEDVTQLKHMLKSQERVINDLQGRNHRQQVLVSRSKKQITDQMEELAAILREIALVQENASNALQLPLNLEEKDLQRILPLLQTFHHKTQASLNENTIKLQQLEQETAIVISVINTIEPKSNMLINALKVLQMSMQQFEQQTNEKRTSLEQKLVKCHTEKDIKLKQIEDIQKLIAEHQEQLQQLQNSNENTMANAELSYNASADQREADLDAFNADLEAAMEKQKELIDVVEQNAEKIEKLISELNL